MNNTNKSNIYTAVASDVATVSIAGAVIVTAVLTALWILRQVGAL